MSDQLARARALLQHAAYLLDTYTRRKTGSPPDAALLKERQKHTDAIRAFLTEPEPNDTWIEGAVDEWKYRYGDVERAWLVEAFRAAHASGCGEDEVKRDGSWIHDAALDLMQLAYGKWRYFSPEKQQQIVEDIIRQHCLGKAEV